MTQKAIEIYKKIKGDLSEMEEYVTELLALGFMVRAIYTNKFSIVKNFSCITCNKKPFKNESCTYHYHHANGEKLC